MTLRHCIKSNLEPKKLQPQDPEKWVITHQIYQPLSGPENVRIRVPDVFPIRVTCLIFKADLRQLII